jgi:hypothetical protein
MLEFLIDHGAKVWSQGCRIGRRDFSGDRIGDGLKFFVGKLVSLVEDDVIELLMQLMGHCGFQMVVK